MRFEKWLYSKTQDEHSSFNNVNTGDYTPYNTLEGMLKEAWQAGYEAGVNECNRVKHSIALGAISQKDK